MKKAFVSVINDLVHDQRVERTCATLMEVGIEPTLVGRKLSNSKAITRSYPTRRFKLLFNKGPLFYAAINLRLLFFGLFKRFDVFYANDLDTLLPLYLLSKLKKKPLVYDSHELFTEVPELKNRFARKVWLSIEKYIFPRLKSVITVNQSIAAIYRKKYKVEISVVRNIPSYVFHEVSYSSSSRGLKLILQGNGINKDRGGEELVRAMLSIENASLDIVGNGEVIGQMKSLTEELGLKERITFHSSVTPEKLRLFTLTADLGFSLDKPSNDNYKYSLPNKLFDYIHSNTPTIASSVIEVKRIVEQYQIGSLLAEVTPKNIADAITFYQDNPEELNRQKSNCAKAAKELCWEKEKEVFIKVLLNAS